MRWAPLNEQKHYIAILWSAGWKCFYNRNKGEEEDLFCIWKSDLNVYVGRYCSSIFRIPRAGNMKMEIRLLTVKYGHEELKNKKDGLAAPDYRLDSLSDFINILARSENFDNLAILLEQEQLKITLAKL